ncbi:hypothetical protein [Micromonospora sp. IBSANI012]|uniref:hypothetical protein n=1 Tax=Micromonospora sp. IBSANI012 TaxID=3457761 RepID=UPI004057F4BB
MLRTDVDIGRRRTSDLCFDSVALTSDAAHPMLRGLAQGACLAIEDAYTLATEAGKTVATGGLDCELALRALVLRRLTPPVTGVSAPAG